MITLMLGLLVANADETATSTLAVQAADTTEYAAIRGSCPGYASIKGNLTPYSEEYCIFHAPGGLYYMRTDAERCFVSEQAAEDAGCRKSRR